jgi:PAS domain S-box-containing protein
VIFVVGAAYYVAARLSLELSLIHENVTPLWPPTGIAVVAFLVFGRRVWPGVALAAFAVNLPISTNAVAAGITAVGNTLAPFVAALLLEKVDFHRELDRLRDAIAIVLLGGLVSMLISASIGAGTLVLFDTIKPHQFLSAWAVWWAGDAMGVLVVAPFLLTLPQYRHPMPLRERIEGVAMLVLVGVVAVLVMGTSLRVTSLVIPILGWIAWRFRQRGAAPAALIVAGIASLAAAHGWEPFSSGTLFEKMLTLQTFNATVAFSSFVFAALVTERERAREDLERAAAELEHRVLQRTVQLSESNEQLADAQHLALLGSWEWLVAENRVTWSDEMFRIHGFAPGSFPVTFEKAVEYVLPEDVPRIRENVESAMRAGRDQDLPDIEYRIVRRDGEERVILGKARLTVDADGGPQRMVGTIQDITETKTAEREHRIAETLQRSLLPDRLPEIPGVRLAARYVPATADIEVGGDWYDVVQLPNGHVGLAIGDVAGHGLRAASLMGQLRMALRAYALEEESPAAVMGRVHRLLQRLHQPEIVTLAYLVFDPDSGAVRFANAGHPPPLVVETSGTTRFLEDALAPPLGAVAFLDRFDEGIDELAPGSSLVLFTDGLVERRGESIEVGLDRLRAEAAEPGVDLDAFCDRVLDTMVGTQVADDVALLVLQPIRLTAEPLRIRVPAEPHVLAPLRQTLRRWLREIDVAPEDANSILIACGEACANAIQHAYGAGEGSLELGLDFADDHVRITVRDEGSWRLSSGPEGGRGMQLMEGFMDSVDVDRGSEGTVVRMRVRVRTGASA